MDRAIAAWLPKDQKPSSTTLEFCKKIQKSYVVYGSMVLLPSTAFQLLNEIEFDNDLAKLYELIAYQLKITHIAYAQPIPPRDENNQTENIIRSPSNFSALYGDFGPTSCDYPPVQRDFEAAFWTTAKQNGIFQTWAPRWTMFSRGNISEKARILTLSSVLSAVEQGKQDGRGCAAVDLYAGIGYFTFSYLKAGVSQVLGWDLNPWSVEGLRRGATANKWSVEVAEDGQAKFDEAIAAEPRLLACNRSNEEALDKIKKFRQLIPPVRHVNCGLLPSSRGSWPIAVGVLDPEMGGWIHIHENFAATEIDVKAEEVRLTIRNLMHENGQVGREPKIDHINALKSYAPGVIHFVLDIYIPPANPI
ncbi:Hypothetical protein R9X50_00763500 [Acrodontium crateriforme]|uniref:tRNA wybutosine-synthesizing protein 2 n=1 Tax=Acrodontium crateriforme TaxID=150365 RepID=A0AAQ3RCV0_9PEZI|nr:Hypothetical protein R9X50_00763500 [Acrodontium crateriforme]